MSDKIDLHGLTKTEAIEAFVKFYNGRVEKGNLKPFEIIHGYGSTGVGGVLLKAIRSFLSNNEDKVEFDYGKDVFAFNPGVTRVIPKKILPSSIDLLGEELLDFCESPKTLTKISGKFHRYELAKIQSALKQLEKSKRLKIFHKGSYVVYQSI